LNPLQLDNLSPTAAKLSPNLGRGFLGEQPIGRVARFVKLLELG